ncbi:MAG TPA: glycosyltransferase family 2 protein [Patescibacteria group bacterium]|nr:glycosyltransferase family 2 protein [Patescibacteria group bacterium]
MAQTKDVSLSVVIPVYNEADGLTAFHEALLAVLLPLKLTAELIYCDDGSTDTTAELIQAWVKTQTPQLTIRLVALSRNFGKENALTAGIAHAKGQAIITLDGDGQHPVELIPQFLEKWRLGAKVVVGVRQTNDGQTFSKRLLSKLFYFTFNRLTPQKLVPGSTDFRLIDQTVQQEFLRLQETDRLTRGLIDWLGFKAAYISFIPKPRGAGKPTYSTRKLVNLALNSIVSLSPVPLHLFAYLGFFITMGTFLLGLTICLEQFILRDPWHWRISGNALLSVLVLFLLGVVLLSQGLLSLYVSHIHNQTKQRPLYVIDRERSAGISNN